MNIHYVDQVKETNSEIIIEKEREQIRLFTSQVRDRFIQVPRALWKVDNELINSSIKKTGLPPADVLSLLAEISKDSLYSGIFFSASDKTPCEQGNGVWEFDPKSGKFVWTTLFPDMVCDGMSIARTRMKVLLDDYKWNTKTTFDTHRSMNIAMVYPGDKKIMGYLILLINTDFLVNRYLTQELNQFFAKNNNEFAIWVHDWVRNRVLIATQPNLELERDKIQISDRFPGLFDNWSILAMVNKPISQEIIENQTTKNLIILALSVSLLLTSLGFIVYSAQKEQEISTLQSEFLSNVTHELKTPLAVIQAAGENIKDGRVKNEERLHYYGKHIYDEAIRLKMMIEKLLDVARFDSNQIKTAPQVLFCDEIIEHIIQRELPVLQTNGFELEIDLQCENKRIFVDKGHFETILLNLIENAVKYSADQKYLRVKSFVKQSKLIIEIEDRGVGIPKSALSHIFDKFYRVENTLTANTKGHGLGLSIVKHLTQQNNGEINVESEFQRGTTFILTFPIVEPNLSTKKRYLIT